MKRGGPLRRRTPLKATKPRRARRGEPEGHETATGGPRGAPKRSRARIRPRSEKRAARRDDERDAKLALYARDGGRCLLEGRDGWGPCAGRWTPHHLSKQSKGWDWALDNLVTLCAAMNDAVEDRPADAHALGLVVRNGETKEDAWHRMRAAGLVAVDAQAYTAV